MRRGCGNEEGRAFRRGFIHAAHHTDTGMHLRGCSGRGFRGCIGPSSVVGRRQGAAAVCKQDGAGLLRRAGRGSHWLRRLSIAAARSGKARKASGWERSGMEGWGVG